MNAHAPTANAVGLNSHHAVKLLALALMTLDHVGAYLYPEMLWLRAVGRVAPIIFFFLIGHAPAGALRRDMMLWALVCAGISPFLGVPVFPTNVLVTLLSCQIALRYVERQALLAREPWMLLAAAFFLFLPSFVLAEYGTEGFLYALMGYAVRTKQMTWRTGKLVALVALVAFLLVQSFAHPYSPSQLLCMYAGVTFMTFYLARFVYRSVSFPWQRLVAPLHFWTRHSMQYYVIHRAILQALGLMTGALTAGVKWL